jgi:large subunit ribosomal protein L4
MKLEILGTKSKTAQTIELVESIFNVKDNPNLLAQYIRTYLLNKRVGNASTKTRGAVSGTGKKPWRQKGTGRARVGQARNPIWRHGGVSHGPHPKSWQLAMPKKMRRAALFTALSLRNRQNKLVVFETFEFKEARTKEFLAFIGQFSFTDKPLFVTETTNEKMKLGARNIHGVKIATEGSLNAFDVMRANTVVFEKAAVEKFQGKYAKDK